ncbi:hypothetical protein [Haloarchaeobius sp. DFWS5]|uniref:hypothetical protein n=1 Tax=Haloarchaeobius sp. DFWS5 TaxID=3446114 RepID=UPI003EBE3412
MTPSVTDSPARDGRRRKATLFCPTCDHDSPPDGDWVLDRRETGTAYDCPDCETTITVRRPPKPDRSEDAPEPVHAASVATTHWFDYVRTVQQAVHRTAVAWYPTD